MQQNSNQKHYDHVMICHDTCYEGINTHVICHDSNEMYDKNVQLKNDEQNRISKDEWYYLVDTLESWRVFNPRAVIKKDPVAAWKCMNICKDKNVRVKGAYFTACFRTELAKKEFKKKIGAA